MATIPGDELGRAWVDVIWDDEPSEIKEGFGVLFSVDDDGAFEALGHAVVIWAGGASAICVGAAHSFEELGRRQRERSGLQNGQIAAAFLRNGPNYIDPSHAKVTFIIGGVPHICDIRQVIFQEGYDVALFTVHSPDGAAVFGARTALDFAAPQVGDVVAVVANQITVQNGEPGTCEMSAQFRMRFGVVTDVQFGKAHLPGLSFFIRTTIPVYGGMSGGALVKKPVLGENMVLLGIVSTDFSPEAAFNNYLVEGNSACSLLWPALGLSLVASLNGEEPRPRLIQEFRTAAGGLDDRTRDVEVHVREREMTELMYIDRRVSPPQVFRLDIPLSN
jgi:Trypsin-like peptidase domain